MKVSLITAVTLLVGSLVSGTAVIYRSAAYSREKTMESGRQQTEAAAHAVGKELEYEMMDHFTDTTLTSYYDYVLQKYGASRYILVEGGEVVCNRTAYEVKDPADVRWAQRSVIQKSKDRYLLLVGRRVPASGSREYKLISIQDITMLYEDVYRQSLLCFGICGSVAFVAALLVFMAVGHILSPLRELQQAARDISGGSLERRAGVRSRDEIGTLARSFNEMADNIYSLKLENMEKKLAAKQLALNNLQLQIRPHFLLNTFNLMFNLASEKIDNLKEYFIKLLKKQLLFLSSSVRLVLLLNYLLLPLFLYHLSILLRLFHILLSANSE